MKRLVTIILMLGVFTTLTAQRVVNICGEYTYYTPENITPAQAKQIALQRARLSGLIQAFNQTVYQSNTTVVTNRNGESSIDLYSFGGSVARGEWIEDAEEPKYIINYEQDMLVVNVTVCGKAREIRSAGIEIGTKVLRNGTDPRFESDKFNSGDDLYLWFKSPVDGYVSVWLLDRSDQKVYCLLPYRNSPQGAVEVKHDEPYIFFHQDRKLKNWQDIDEYSLTANESMEWNEIYIVFSPNPYAKASVIASDVLVPRELHFKDFSAWLIRCQTKDPDMVVNKQLIVIKKI